jgi:hypothetical protein
VREGADLGRGGVGPRQSPRAVAVPELAGEEDPRPLHPLQAELIAAAGGSILLVALLFLKWFGLGGPVGRFAPRAVAAGSEGAWNTLTLLRWPALVAGGIALLPLLVRPAHRWVGLPRRMPTVVAVLGAVMTLLLGYRVLIDLPDPSHVVDQKAGAILGLLGALLIVVGGVESMRAQTVHSSAGRRRGRSRRSRGLAAEIARINA